MKYSLKDFFTKIFKNNLASNGCIRHCLISIVVKREGNVLYIKKIYQIIDKDWNKIKYGIRYLESFFQIKSVFSNFQDFDIVGGFPHVTSEPQVYFLWKLIFDPYFK